MKPEYRYKDGSRHGEDTDIDIQSCSSMDCTGLIPSLPQTEAEIEHYNQLYKFLPGRVNGSETKIT